MGLLDGVLGFFGLGGDKTAVVVGDKIVWYPIQEGEVVAERFTGTVHKELDDGTVLIKLIDSDISGLYKVAPKVDCTKLSTQETPQ